MTGPEYAGLREGDAVVAGGEGEDAVPGRGEARHDAVHLHQTQNLECAIELQLKFREDYIFTFTFYLLCEIFAKLRLKLLCNVT